MCDDFNSSTGCKKHIGTRHTLSYDCPVRGEESKTAGEELYKREKSETNRMEDTDIRLADADDLERNTSDDSEDDPEELETLIQEITEEMTFILKQKIKSCGPQDLLEAAMGELKQGENSSNPQELQKIQEIFEGMINKAIKASKSPYMERRIRPASKDAFSELMRIRKRLPLNGLVVGILDLYPTCRYAVFGGLKVLQKYSEIRLMLNEQKS